MAPAPLTSEQRQVSINIVPMIAFVLQTNEEPFLLWSEISAFDQERYTKKARRLLQIARATQPAFLSMLYDNVRRETQEK
jgi:hypothetical protein